VELAGVGDEPDPPPPPQPLRPTMVSQSTPKSTPRQIATVQELLVRLREKIGTPKSQNKPQLAVASETCASSAADVAAVVVTRTVKVAVAPLVSVREEGVTVQAAFGGACEHVSMTVPPEPVAETRDREYVAVWPGATVWEVVLEPPVPKAKDGVVPVPERARVCGLPAALSFTVRVPWRAPVVEGVKVTEIAQLA